MSASCAPTADAARRAFLVRGATLVVAACAALPARRVRAAPTMDVRGDAFDAVRFDDALRALGDAPTASDAIAIELPALSENGAVVPVTVTSAIPRTDAIMLLVEANPVPMVATFAIPEGTEPWVATRIKLAGTCRVTALARADGRLYAASAHTQVVLGGCG